MLASKDAQHSLVAGLYGNTTGMVQWFTGCVLLSAIALCYIFFVAHSDTDGSASC